MASETTHTPGPWIYYADLPSTEPNWHIVTTANKQRVLANVHIEPGNTMDEANARLITVAPDLLKALEMIATGEIAGEEHNHRDTVDVMRSIARAALSKARSA